MLLFLFMKLFSQIDDWQPSNGRHRHTLRRGGWPQPRLVTPHSSRVNLPYREMFLECCWTNMENAHVEGTNYKVQNKYKNRRSKHFPQLISIWVQTIEFWKYWSICGGKGTLLMHQAHHWSGVYQWFWWGKVLFYHLTISWQKAQQCLGNNKINCTTNSFTLIISPYFFVAFT